MDLKTFKVKFQTKTISIPYYFIKGASDGPTIFISGGMHGDELNGIVAVKEFIDWAEEVSLYKILKGSIFVFPVLNPSGFNKQTRNVPEDQIDLNRAFGIDVPYKISEKLALELVDKVFSKCDFGIDIHDAGEDYAIISHCRIPKREDYGDDGVQKLHEMAKIFGLKVLLERKGHPNMLATTMLRHYATPVLTVEIGGAGRVREDYQVDTLRGLQNMLISNEMLSGDLESNDKQDYLYERYAMAIKEGAYIEMQSEVGDLVHTGEVLGTAYFPITQKEIEIKSPICGVIFSEWADHQIPKGENIFSILKKENCHTDELSDDHFTKPEKLDVSRIRM